MTWLLQHLQHIDKQHEHALCWHVRWGAVEGCQTQLACLQQNFGWDSMTAAEPYSIALPSLMEFVNQIVIMT